MRKKASKYSLFLLFLLPLSLLIYNEFSEINRWIDFTRKERLGVEYNQSLVRLLKSLQHHRGMTYGYLSGAPSFKDAIAAEHSRIEDDIEAIDLISSKYGRLLKIDDKWEAFKKSWKELEYAEHSLSPKEFFDNHTDIIAGIISLISHIGETSNLILDPELPTSYLMDCLTFKCPVIIENIGQARGTGIKAAVSHFLSEDEKRELISQAGIIKANYAEAEETVRKIFSANQDIKSRMESVVNEFDAGIKKFLNTLEREIINAPKITITPSDYYEAATKVMDAGFNLYDRKALALDKLLEARIHGYQREGYLFGSVLIVISSAFIYLLAAFIKNMDELEISKGELNRKVEFLTDSGRFIRNILDSQEDIVIMTDGKNLQYVNKSFLDFAGHGSIEEFRQDHRCLCDLFIRAEGFVHKKDGDDCIDHAVSESKEGFKVKMFDIRKGMDRVFLGNTKRLPGEEKLYVISFRDITDIDNESRRFEYLSVTDSLTGIYNRLKFDNVLEGEIQRAKRFKRTFSLVMFDIDQFKDINDTFGHDAGDDLLKIMTRVLAKHVRSTDTFARWGGDEFAVLVVETPLEGATALAEKLRADTEATDFAFGKVTCSFGVTEFKGTDDLASIIKRVDEALYEAKSSGRNKVYLK